MSKTKCNNCKKEFNVYIINDYYPGGKTKEEVVCPFCKTKCYDIMTSGFIKTSK